MINLPVNSAPQPAAGKAANASPADGANGAGDQEATPFAKVLADKVNKPADAKSGSGEEAVADKTAAPEDKAAPQADSLNALLSQIPVELRDTNVLDRMARLTAGDLANATDNATALPTIAVPAVGVAIPSADIGDAPLQVNLTARNLQAQPSVVPETAGNFGEALAAAEQQLLADASGQRVAGNLEPATSPAQMNTSTVSQASIATMTGSASSQPATVVQTVATPLANPAWGDDFSQKISWLVTQNSQVAELHLNPPNLGPLDVVLKISDNQATALFASPHAAVRDAVENALPKLRELLADNGIMLSNATVGDQSPRDQGAEEFAGRKDGSSSGSAADNAAETTLSVTPVRRHNGMVDTFA